MTVGRFLRPFQMKSPNQLLLTYILHMKYIEIEKKPIFHVIALQ